MSSPPDDLRFLPLLDLTLAHSYYEDGRCPDFQVTPDAPTRRLLSRLRAVTRVRADGISVAVPVAATTGSPVIALPGDATCTFQLIQKNPDFCLFTEGSTLMPDGVGVGGGLACTLRYPGPAARAGSLFATVDISPVRACGSVAAPTVCVQFIPRKAYWGYYLVTDLDPGGHGFTIADLAPGGTSGIGFPDGSCTDLHQTPDPADQVAALLARQYPRAKCWRFVSATPVPCRQVPRAHLQLRLDTSALVDRLPTPSYVNYASITNRGTLIDCFYQVLKHLSPSSRTRV